MKCLADIASGLNAENGECMHVKYNQWDWQWSRKNFSPYYHDRLLNITMLSHH